MKYTTVLFVSENEKTYADLKQLLSDSDIHIDFCHLSNQEITELFELQPDLVLLDCREEGFHELTLCQKIRNLYSGLLILLSSQEKEQFTLLALKLGADITLPAHNNALLLAANIRSILQRFDSFSTCALQFGALTIDARKRDAFLCGKQANLSTIEFELLWLLSQKAGRVVSRETIHKDLYATNYNGYDRSIDLYVSRIRQKIGDDPVSPKYLKTVRGTGYQFIGDLNRGTRGLDDTNCYIADTLSL